MSDERILVEIASYNTSLQAETGLPQDLVDWLSPTLQVANFLSQAPRAPDIIAVGFQELLPLHLGLAGFSTHVIESRHSLILSQIEKHAPKNEKYSLIAKVVHVGIALLVYGKDAGIARRVEDVQTQSTGCGPAYMGNKGAVGARFRVRDEDGGIGEVYTFVCAHLTAHTYNLQHRIADYHHIVGTLLFPPLPGYPSKQPTTIYDTSHLFFFGDLNFRLKPLPVDLLPDPENVTQTTLHDLMENDVREKVKDYDELIQERDQKGTVFIGLKEGEFWKFQGTYKYVPGEVSKYNTTRIPCWPDRILYTTYADSPESPRRSAIVNALYTSIPAYTSSDHKPVVAALLLPPLFPSVGSTVPLLRLPPTYTPKPDPYATLKRYTGRTLDRIVGYAWWFLTILGSTPGLLGMLSIGVWSWLKWSGCFPSWRENEELDGV